MRSDSILSLKGNSGIVQLVHYSFGRAFPKRRTSSKDGGRRNLTRDRYPDMMILDMVLEGVNGLEIYWKLKKDYSVESFNILGLTHNDKEDSNIEIESGDFQKLFSRELGPAELN